MPGRVMLSVHWVRSVSRCASSRRGRACPTSATRPSATVLMPAPLGRCCIRTGFGGNLHGPNDVLVAGTAAQVAFQPGADLLFGRVWVVGQQVDRRDDHPGRAVTALQGMALMECLLYRVQRPVVGGEALDRGDLAAGQLGRPAPNSFLRSGRRGGPYKPRSWRYRNRPLSRSCGHDLGDSGRAEGGSGCGVRAGRRRR